MIAAATVGTGGAAAVPAVTEEVATAPIEWATCATLGAAVGGAAGGVIGSLIIKWDKNADPLVKAFNAKDASSIGICTATPKPNQIDIVAFLDKIGAVVKITGNTTTDGIIVLVGGFLILMLLFKSVGGKKRQ